ncbi:MAG: hypothetical protein JXA73_24065 [Acidobacteria bacterium]|nr:hypothetical protein [Acidobacteriota bacterium]
MWRSEERLKYWLEKGSRTQESGFGAGLLRKLNLKLRLRNAADAVRNESLELGASAVSLDEDLAATACVKDGLADLMKYSLSESEPDAGMSAFNSMIRQTVLIGKATIYDTRLPDEHLARIRNEKVDMNPACRSSVPGLSDPEVHEPANLFCRPPLLLDGNRLLFANPPVQASIFQISTLPHSRTSIRIEGLKDSERRGFLREAEAMKGIASDRAELLAVFRHVPIEVISRLRFLAEEKTIIYSIARDFKLTRTRVHDMAAVLDVVGSEVYLVPHRTQFRSVSLN